MLFDRRVGGCRMVESALAASKDAGELAGATYPSSLHLLKSICGFFSVIEDLKSYLEALHQRTEKNGTVQTMPPSLALLLLSGAVLPLLTRSATSALTYDLASVELSSGCITEPSWWMPAGF